MHETRSESVAATIRDGIDGDDVAHAARIFLSDDEPGDFAALGLGYESERSTQVHVVGQLAPRIGDTGRKARRGDLVESIEVHGLKFAQTEGHGLIVAKAAKPTTSSTFVASRTNAKVTSV